MDSILDSIKKLLGIQPEYKSFDQDIMMHINAVFVVLNQLGIGPSEGFSINSRDIKWSKYSTELNTNLVKTYVYLKVRLMFDPPASATLVESINAMINELEWRLYLEGDKGGE